MPYTPCREGKLSPSRNQTLYWVKFGMWAIGKGLKGDWEIFKAQASSHTECGFLFTFRYSLPNTPALLNHCDIIRPYLSSNLEKANLDVLSVYLPRFVNNLENDGKLIEIDTSYKPFDKEKVFANVAKRTAATN